MSRPVLLHCCKPSGDDGRPFSCSCTHRLSKKNAQARVDCGQAKWKRQLVAGRGLVELRNEVILLAPRFPLHARVPGSQDIASAYTEDGNRSERARARIEWFHPSKAGAA